MNSVRSPISCLVLVLLAGSLLATEARPVKIWSDEELAKQSKLVIVATVVEVKPTDRRRTLKVDNFAPLPLKIHRANLKVEKVLKGTAGETISLEFGQIDGGIPPNGPSRVYIEKGKRYRLYLRQSKNRTHWYPSFESHYDSDQSVKPVKG